MIHIVHAGNRDLYAQELDQLFRLRAKFFKEILGWSALTVTDGKETDVYDDERAIYLLALEADGQISCSLRLRPTTDRSLLMDHFPHLVADDHQRFTRTDVWETCRYFASPNARGPEGARRREELRMAMVELANTRGVSRIVAITDMMWLPPLVQGSWTTRLLGLPAAYDEGECIAFEILCDDEALLRMRERYGAAGDILLDIHPATVPANLPPHRIEAMLAAEGAVAASEIQEISRLSEGLSAQDARVITNVIKRISAIQQREGEPTALAAIARLRGSLLKRDLKWPPGPGRGSANLN